MLSLLVVVTDPQNTNVRNAETVDCIKISKSDTRSVKLPAYRLNSPQCVEALLLVSRHC